MSTSFPLQISLAFSEFSQFPAPLPFPQTCSESAVLIKRDETITGRVIPTMASGRTSFTDSLPPPRVLKGVREIPALTEGALLPSAATATAGKAAKTQRATVPKPTQIKFSD